MSSAKTYKFSKKEIRSALETLNKLERASTSLEREDLLVKEKDNKALCFIFRVALGGRNYHVSPSRNSISVVTIKDSRKAFEDFSELCFQLSRGDLVGTEAVSTADRFLASVPSELKKWFVRAISHDLRVGVTQTMALRSLGNNIITNTENESDWTFYGSFKPKLYEGARIRFPIAAEPEVNGSKISVFLSPFSKKIQAFRSNARYIGALSKTVSFYQELYKTAERIFSITGKERPLFFDVVSVPRMKKNFSKKWYSKTKFFVLDWAWISDYMQGQFLVPWRKRNAVLQKALQQAKCEKLFWLPSKIIYDDIELYKFYDSVIDTNNALPCSGIVLKTLRGPLHFEPNTEEITAISQDVKKTGNVLARDKENSAILVESTGRVFHVGCGFKTTEELQFQIGRRAEFMTFKNYSNQTRKVIRFNKFVSWLD